MKVVVTGANGLVAKAVARVCAAKDDLVIALTRQDLDITDFQAVKSTISSEKPDAIINCAAFTDVDGSESNPETCYAVNETGVGLLASAARETDCAFLTISTDFVFDGEKEGFYTEDDKPNPQSVYGNSKLAGERAAFASYDKSIVVRTGWVFGKGGTNFLSVLPELLADSIEVSAIGDSYGTPTYADDLAARLRELVVLNKFGLFHVSSSGEGMSYFGFSAAVAEMGGFDKANVRAVTASELVRPATRPRNSRLTSVKLNDTGLSALPNWKDALKRYLSR